MACNPGTEPHGDIALQRGVEGIESGPSTVEALEAALSHREPLVRSREISAALEPMTASSSPLLAAWLDQRLLDLDLLEVALVVHAWASSDPEAAMAWAVQQTPPHFERAVSVVLPVYARVDFAGAREALETLIAGIPNFDGTLFRIELVDGGYDAGVLEVIDYLVALGPSSERQTIVRQMVRRKLLREPPEAVIEWVESLSAQEDVALKYTAVLKLGLELPMVDRERAKAWASRAHSGEFDSRLLDSVTRGLVWSGRAQEALEWLLDLPPQVRAGNAIAFAFGAWLGQDPEAARAWAHGTNHDARSDPALRQYALTRIAPEGAAVALEWIERLQDPAERERGRFQVARRWYGRDPDAARAWVEEQDFDAMTRAQILAAHIGHKNRAATRGQSGEATVR